jgi:WD40 repeat protein
MQLWRVMLSGNSYGDTEATDLELQPQDLDVTLSSSDVAVVPTKASIIILHGSTVISKTDVGYQPSAAAISPDGSEIVVGGQDGKLYIYSVKGDTLIQESVLERHRGALTAVRFSPDGTMIASGDQNREAVVWDRDTREVGFCVKLHFDCMLLRISCLLLGFQGGRVRSQSPHS